MRFVEPSKLRAPIRHVFGPIHHGQLHVREQLPNRGRRRYLPRKFVYGLSQINSANDQAIKKSCDARSELLNIQRWSSRRASLRRSLISSSDQSVPAGRNFEKYAWASRRACNRV
jgi:hypothetical protein